jgi:lycopene cyclase domain-containing protein
LAHLVYVALLTGCLAAPVLLELTLRIRLLLQWRRLALTVLPVLIVFGGWDLAAIRDRQWSYNRHWITGVLLPGGLPIEELAFFVVIPICAVATLEAVRRVRPQWSFGDEP